MTPKKKHSQKSGNYCANDMMWWKFKRRNLHMRQCYKIWRIDLKLTQNGHNVNATSPLRRVPKIINHCFVKHSWVFEDDQSQPTTTTTMWTCSKKLTDRYEGVAAHKKKNKIDQIIPVTATICSRHRYEGVWNKERNPNRSARHSNCHHSHLRTEIRRSLSQGKNQKRWLARESNCQHSRVQRLPAGHMSAWFQYISSIMQPWSAVLTQETSLMFMNSE